MTASVNSSMNSPVKTISLELHAHGKDVALLRRRPHTGLGYLVGYAKDILQVMAHLMGDHIALRRIAVGAQLVLHVLVEGQVDIDLAVTRTVKRSHLRLRTAASRLNEASKEHECRRLISLAHLPENAAPDAFC